ncbi:nicotinamide/nicotinic acid mononucleotide adenylyltransferase 1 [Chrysoperla carnea]|uniref:nicotinamide/nicotinic acid mononucleotide adenylyltransferase 1 n=1 Tax=Chrysoperla carnea TaxID=189513 RepID=UPI001D07E12B|nr:nicotinamide/nicotinic acid mononucleotide adenylyltransferase 1 [Chrysoperla carnea]
MDNNINENDMRNSPQIVLIACGSFNPPTFMHLRMFEIARDYLQRKGEMVIGGIMSPVHDAYGKKELEHSTHRITMLKEALKDSDWIKVSPWESQQEGWSKTRVVVQYHQNHLNAIVNDCSITPSNSVLSWVPDTLLNQNQNNKRKIQLKLLCGADLLESFAVPNLWASEDMECLVGEHGLVVISRNGSNSEKFIYESDLLYHYVNNIDLVTEWITNELSSTKIRRALRRSESVKYLIPDAVIDYVYKHNLYGSGVQNIKEL